MTVVSEKNDLHIVIFEHHRVLQFFLGLLIDFNLLIKLCVFFLPAFNGGLQLLEKTGHKLNLMKYSDL